jgi:hypothetical protein
VNEKHVIRHVLQDGDVLLIGKHKLVFDEVAVAEIAPVRRAVPTLGATAYLDTKKHRALLTKLREERARGRAQKEAASRPASSGGAPADARNRLGMLHVIGGKSDRSAYRLETRTSFIGKSEAALVRLGGWFTPRAVAAIVQTDQGYAITPLSSRVLINGALLEGTRDLADGDVLDFNGLILRFQFTDQPRHVPTDQDAERSEVQQSGEASVA